MLLEKSSDSALFHYAFDGDLASELVELAEKGRRHPAESLLKRAYTQELTQMQAQSLGVLWLMAREGMMSFATSRPARGPEVVEPEQRRP